MPPLEHNAPQAGFPETIDPAKDYRVTLSKAVPYGGAKLSARAAHVMKGDVLRELLEGTDKGSVYGAQEA